MPHKLQTIESHTTLSAVEQALINSENLKALGTVLQKAYGETVVDDIFSSLMSSLDSITHTRLSQTSNTLDRLLSSNIA